jgi:hypothetical protein
LYFTIALPVNSLLLLVTFPCCTRLLSCSLPLSRPGRSNLLAEFTQLDEHLYRNLDLLQGQVSSLLDTLSRLEETDSAQGHKKRLFQLRKKKSAGVTMSNATTSSTSTRSAGSDRASPVMAVTSSSQELDMDPTAGNLTGMASLSNSNQSLNTLGSAAGGGGSSSAGRPTSFPGGDVSTLRSVRGYPSESGIGSSGSVLLLFKK